MNSQAFPNLPFPHNPLLRPARKWWRMNRPVGWTLSQHLKNPTVNTTTPDEGALARAVARTYL